MSAGVDHDIPTVLGRLRVTVSGTGEAIVMWPSLLMDRSLWDAQVERFADSFTTIAIDPPGHGESAALTRTFSLAECATCVVEILDTLGHDRAHLLGNSWGAMVGGVFGALHPDRAGSLVLMNGTASPAPRIQRAQFSALLLLSRVLRGIRPPLTGSVVKAFLGPTSRKNRPEAVRRVVEIAGRNDVRSTGFAVRSVVSLRPDNRVLFGSITTPTLVIAGREDATFPIDEVRAMAASIPGSEFVVLEDAAHLVALEVPDVVNDLVEKFLV